jgi:predicted Ser/Thr protein kinase
MPLTTGTRLGPYEILGPIGAGGMGEVYRAKDTKLDREVAVKILPAAMAQDRERLARFEREAKVLASLNHPHIAQIYGVEQNALVMELVGGSTLTVPQPLETALDYARQIAEALEAAHEKGITHRDLKPANIMITPEGVVKVLDFGLASMPGGAAGDDPANSPTMTIGSTQAGMIMGTAGYMSPEQAAGKVVDKRSDIWSFGVVLWEMLAGRRLFEGETVSQILASVLKDAIDVEQVAAPAAIRTLLGRCLERNPKLRLRDIGEARIAIDAALRNPRPESGAPRARPPFLWMAAAGIAVAAAAGFAWLWLRVPASQAPAMRFGVEHSIDCLSPDGRWILESTKTALRVRSIQDKAWRSLPGTEDSDRPAFWSEDSKAVGFVSGGRLRAVALEGSTATDLGPAPDYEGGSWRGAAEDGTIVLAAGGRMRALGVKSHQMRDLPLDLPAGAQPIRPVFLPEGDGFLFLLKVPDGYQVVRGSLSAAKVATLCRTSTQVSIARNPHTGEWHLFFLSGEADERPARVLKTVSIDPRTGEFRGKPARLLQGLSRNAPGFQFAIANSGLIYWRMASVALPAWRLTWFDRTGKVLGKIGEKANLVALALSPDESKAAVQADFPEEHIWIYDLQTGIGKRLTNLPEVELSPQWAPGGKEVYYSVVLQGTGSQLIRQSVELDGAREVVWETKKALVVLADVSADGRYAVLADNSGSYLLDLQSAPPRVWQPMMKEDGNQIRLSPDGRTMAYSNSSGTYLSAFPPNGAAPHRIPDIPGAGSWMFFSADGATLYQATRSDALFAFPIGPGLRAGEATFLFPWVHSDRARSRIGAATRDGKRILAIASDDPEEMWGQVLSDWTTLLPAAK